MFKSYKKKHETGKDPVSGKDNSSHDLTPAEKDTGKNTAEKNIPEEIQEDLKHEKKKKIRTVISFAAAALILILLFLMAVNTGSLKMSTGRLIKGLFIKYDEDVATVFDLRFPRIVLSILAGAGTAVAGVLFQAVLKNPLADPGIIGISSGAQFMASLITVLFPSMFFWTPLLAFIGGSAAFFIVYSLSWKGGLSPLRIILTGIAVSAVFSGLSSALQTMSGGDRTGVAAIVNANISQKTWNDVKIMLPYTAAGLILAMIFVSECNILSLEDRTARSLGVNVNRTRVVISLTGCLLAGISAAVVGAVSFLGLIVPHIGRLLVGSDHKKLIPFSAIFGADVFLLADTIGRTIAPPYEVNAAVIMSIIGGPFFIVLLRRSKNYGR